MTTVIKAEGISKRYIIGHEISAPYATLRDVLAEGVKTIGRKVRGSLIGGRTFSSDPGKEEFWALRDLNFEIWQGDRVGIIGRNGAGKSTLLKILSRITEPTLGRVEIEGRVASLLEVGTGFHPELTGRENIFLNGAVLGMTKSEIKRKFDEIVSFAEVEKFLDTPVKHYSSGMYVRLAFAVAAHLEPEILIVDEVLAVGDIAFQRKSLGKMEEAARSGRTVLFVSHNLGAVRNLCRSVLLLENGHLKYQGLVEEGVAIYERGLTGEVGSLVNTHFHGPLSDRIRFDELIYRQGEATVTIVDPLQDIEIELCGLALRTFQALDLSIGVFRDGFHLASCHDAPYGSAMREGSFRSRFHIPAQVMKPGRYTIGIGALASGGDWTWGSDVAILDVSENWGDQSSARDRGAVSLQYTAERIQ